MKRNKLYKTYDACMGVAVLFSLLDAWAIFEYYWGIRFKKDPPFYRDIFNNSNNNVRDRYCIFGTCV